MDLGHAQDLVELAATVDARWYDDEAPGLIDELDARAEELPAAATALLESGEQVAALRLVGAVSRFCQARGRVDLGRALASQVLGAVDDAGSNADRGRALLTEGELAFRQKDQDAALSATEAALLLARHAGDTELEARAEFNLARIAFRDGDAAAIRAHAQRMLGLAGDDPRLRYGGVHMLAWAEHTAGNVEAAIALFEENVTIARAAGNRVGEAGELLNLASLALAAGDPGRAAPGLAEGLAIAVELDSRYLLPGTLTDVGRLAVLRGRHEEGLELIAAGEAQYAAAGLTPDPGDDAFTVARDEAAAVLGAERSAEISERGAGRSLADAIELARRELDGSR